MSSSIDSDDYEFSVQISKIVDLTFNITNVSNTHEINKSKGYTGNFSLLKESVGRHKKSIKFKGKENIDKSIKTNRQKVKRSRKMKLNVIKSHEDSIKSRLRSRNKSILNNTNSTDHNASISIIENKSPEVKQTRKRKSVDQHSNDSIDDYLSQDFHRRTKILINTNENSKRNKKKWLTLKNYPKDTKTIDRESEQSNVDYHGQRNQKSTDNLDPNNENLDKKQIDNTTNSLILPTLNSPCGKHLNSINRGLVTFLEHSENFKTNILTKSDNCSITSGKCLESNAAIEFPILERNKIIPGYNPSIITKDLDTIISTECLERNNSLVLSQKKKSIHKKSKILSENFFIDREECLGDFNKTMSHSEKLVSEENQIEGDNFQPYQSIIETNDMKFVKNSSLTSKTLDYIETGPQSEKSISEENQFSLNNNSSLADKTLEIPKEFLISNKTFSQNGKLISQENQILSVNSISMIGGLMIQSSNNLLASQLNQSILERISVIPDYNTSIICKDLVYKQTESNNPHVVLQTNKSSLEGSKIVPDNLIISSEEYLKDHNKTMSENEMPISEENHILSNNFQINSSIIEANNMVSNSSLTGKTMSKEFFISNASLSQNEKSISKENRIPSDHSPVNQSIIEENNIISGKKNFLISKTFDISKEFFEIMSQNEKSISEENQILSNNSLLNQSIIEANNIVSNLSLPGKTLEMSKELLIFNKSSSQNQTSIYEENQIVCDNLQTNHSNNEAKNVVSDNNSSISGKKFEISKEFLKTMSRKEKSISEDNQNLSINSQLNPSNIETNNVIKCDKNSSFTGKTFEMPKEFVTSNKILFQNENSLHEQNKIPSDHLHLIHSINETNDMVSNFNLSQVDRTYEIANEFFKTMSRNEISIFEENQVLPNNSQLSQSIIETNNMVSDNNLSDAGKTFEMSKELFIFNKGLSQNEKSITKENSIHSDHPQRNHSINEANNVPLENNSSIIGKIFEISKDLNYNKIMCQSENPISIENQILSNSSQLSQSIIETNNMTSEKDSSLTGKTSEISKEFLNYNETMPQCEKSISDENLISTDKTFLISNKTLSQNKKSISHENQILSDNSASGTSEHLSASVSTNNMLTLTQPSQSILERHQIVSNENSLLTNQDLDIPMISGGLKANKSIVLFRAKPILEESRSNLSCFDDTLNYSKNCNSNQNKNLERYDENVTFTWKSMILSDKFDFPMENKDASLFREINDMAVSVDKIDNINDSNRKLQELLITDQIDDRKTREINGIQGISNGSYELNKNDSNASSFENLESSLDKEKDARKRSLEIIINTKNESYSNIGTSPILSSMKVLEEISKKSVSINDLSDEIFLKELAVKCLVRLVNLKTVGTNKSPLSFVHLIEHKISDILSSIIDNEQFDVVNNEIRKKDNGTQTDKLVQKKTVKIQCELSVYKETNENTLTISPTKIHSELLESEIQKHNDCGNSAQEGNAIEQVGTIGIIQPESSDIEENSQFKQSYFESTPINLIIKKKRELNLNLSSIHDMSLRHKGDSNNQETLVSETNENINSESLNYHSSFDQVQDSTKHILPNKKSNLKKIYYSVIAEDEELNEKTMRNNNQPSEFSTHLVEDLCKTKKRTSQLNLINVSPIKGHLNNPLNNVQSLEEPNDIEMRNNTHKINYEFSIHHDGNACENKNISELDWFNISPIKRDPNNPPNIIQSIESFKPKKKDRSFFNVRDPIVIDNGVIDRGNGKRKVIKPISHPFETIIKDRGKITRVILPSDETVCRRKAILNQSRSEKKLNEFPLSHDGISIVIEDSTTKKVVFLLNEISFENFLEKPIKIQFKSFTRKRTNKISESFFKCSFDNVYIIINENKFLFHKHQIFLVPKDIPFLIYNGNKLKITITQIVPCKSKKK